MRIAQIDFDGTLVRNNVGIELMKAYSKDLPATLDCLTDYCEEQDYRKIELEANINAAWYLTNCSPQAEIIAAAKRLAKPIGIISIFTFLEALEKKGYTPIIVSNGIEPYIRAFVSLAYKVYATPAIWDYPNKCWHTAPNLDLKENIARNMPVELYIGDSIETDFYAAATIVKKEFPVFAPYESSLFKYKGILPIQGYSSFEDILAKL